MNRIILIGNGFDLAHGLETKYEHFITDYWKQFSDKIYDRRNMGYDTLCQYTDDSLVEFTLIRQANFTTFAKGTTNPVSSLKELNERIRQYIDIYQGRFGNAGGIKLGFKSEFFEVINRKLATQKWVDIENEYYRMVKNIHRRHSNPDIDSDPDIERVQVKIDRLKAQLKKLNDDLKIVKDKLSEYLKDIQKRDITWGIVNESIRKIIYEPVNPRDVAVGGKKLLVDHFVRLETNSPGAIPDEINQEIERGNYYSLEDMIEQQLDNGERTIECGCPLLLNFNYTKTANFYDSEHYEVWLNHINGKLDDPDNPIIFGYGDEVDETYKKIADLNDNEYLQNIKSIRYLETDNYRRLLTFIDSAPYQIYIMGHSCGNSDRTLLNTLFEHENCVSIKPFYYQWEKKDDTGNTIKNDKGEPVLEDDYIDIVQNISRNFRNPTLMRDRVVNKTYCEPLPQNPRP